ncbi:molybdopterin-dependent oxidoreductase [Pedococcus sp. 5OH_020]|uniref:molybdopterin-dependent oxidoreductase n=1 Tax=Pedococcus sp. 5OH_020 TaxID=2989814 RepID=UPI0022E9D156|nr:molybdopterin-dependent oxidoreductase [Pedococcus sp. 5OH_020]
MNGRFANLVLLALVPLAAASGFVMFLLGSGPVWAIAALHGVVGLAVVVLVPWKSVVVRRGLRRARRSGRATSLLLTVAVVLALLTGMAHRVGILLADSRMTTLQAHVGTGVGAAALTLWHARRRRINPRRTDLSRRWLLRCAVVASAAGLLEVSARVASALTTSPGARRSTGSFQLASSSVAAVPETSWLFDRVPAVDPDTWRLTVATGDDSRDWSLQDLADWDDRQVAVLDCTGGWWTRHEWSGVRLARLLPPTATGTVEVTSATGYARRLPLTDQLLLATRIDGTELSAGHGAPVRLVVPGRRGYHWVKWVVRVQHDSEPWWVQVPLPLQ